MKIGIAKSGVAAATAHAAFLLAGAFFVVVTVLVPASRA